VFQRIFVGLSLGEAESRVHAGTLWKQREGGQEGHGLELSPSL
jgi:hypothetical protein